MSGFPGTLDHDIARAGEEREPDMAGSPEGSSRKPLAGRVALVAGATRGAGRGIAVELGAAGATVYVTGRSTRARRSEYDRPETIEDTADLVTAAGGRGIAVPADHLDPGQVAVLVDRVAREEDRLDVLVNDIWGGENLFEWDSPVWEHDLDKGLRLLRLAVETHAITSHHALPLLLRRPGGLVVEVTDGTDDYNRDHYRNSFFYDLAKTSVLRMAFALGHELGPRGATAVALTPGWLRSEIMLDHFGVREENWRDALDRVPHFAISETPRYVGRAVTALAADPDVARFNGRSLSSGGLAREYGFTDLDGSRPDAWRYVVEVQDAGKPADVTGYR
jgi:NAD(P)-dependent dehydrogenase (short-subunit alcohol dehydrogenase family)